VTVDLPVEDGPSWISHIEVSRADDGRLELRIMKTSGSDYGAAFIGFDKLALLNDLL